MFRTYQTQLLLSQSLASDFESPEWDVTGLAKGAIEIAWTGVDAIDSVFYLEGSVTGVVWRKISGTDVGIVETGSGDYIYALTDALGINKIRLAYIANSNSAGTMTAIANSKVERAGDNPGPS